MDFGRLSGSEIYRLSKELLASGQNLGVQHIDDLVTVLQYHEWRYYVQDDPIISDKEYDTLYKSLEQIERSAPEKIRPDSPTQRVSSDLADGFETVEHLVPMLSLDNTYNADDLLHFDKTIKKLVGLDSDAAVSYTVEPKFDGGSVAVIYENDMLSRAATRGNGVRGDNITQNIKTIKSLPLKINLSAHGIHRVELRGEALIRLDLFQQMNAQREQAGQALFANPRNAATGGLRMKDPQDAADRNLDLFLYQMGYAVDADNQDRLQSFSTHSEILEFLDGLGLKIPRDAYTVCDNIQAVITTCADWTDRRAQYPYELDGLVIKVNRLDYQEKCGYTSHHPRWAAAYKFAAKQATSKLVDVEYQIGKIGSITPVAKVEPVPLAGVTISSISLHNEDFIRSKDLRLGDVVLLERAGDVIPYIVKPMEDLRTGLEVVIQYPTHCPSCQTQLVRVGDEAAWRCPNTYGCPEQIRQRIIFHVSKDAMDIDGMGPSYVDRFMALGWLKDIADVYTLDYGKIVQLEGFGRRSAEKLQAAITQAKSQPISRLLHSLSIHHLGKRASKIIAEQISNVFELQKWTEEQFVALKDIGPVVAHNVASWMAEEENINILKKLADAGVNMMQTEEDKPVAENVDGALFGKTILFTGTLEKMTRNEAKKIATAAGAKNISVVSSNLNILVVGAKAGSKLKKAEALGTVEIWTEDDFIAITENM